MNRLGIGLLVDLQNLIVIYDRLGETRRPFGLRTIFIYQSRAERAIRKRDAAHHSSADFAIRSRPACMPVYDYVSILFERHRQLNTDGNFAGVYDLRKYFA